MTEAAILIVEDEAIIALDLGMRLRRMGFRVAASASSGTEAIDLAGALRPTVIFMDIGLQGEMDGLEAAEHIRTRFGLPVVFLTALGDAATRRRAEGIGPVAFLNKPFSDADLARVVRAARDFPQGQGA